MELVIDIETTIAPTDKWKEGQSLIGPGKGDASPFNERNKIVSVHVYNDGAYAFMDLNRPSGFSKLLTDATLLIGHNLKFDLMWLRECGFKYEGKLWDTMIYEYIKAGGQSVDLKLDECCKRYGIEGKIDKVAEYWKDGINTDSIPEDILEEYGNNDVTITYELYQAQKKEELLDDISYI